MEETNVSIKCIMYKQCFYPRFKSYYMKYKIFIILPYTIIRIEPSQVIVFLYFTFVYNTYVRAYVQIKRIRKLWLPKLFIAFLRICEFVLIYCEKKILMYRINQILGTQSNVLYGRLPDLSILILLYFQIPIEKKYYNVLWLLSVKLPSTQM